MPFKIVKRKGKRPYKIVRSDTGKVVGSSTSKKKAAISASKRMQGAHGKKRKR